MDTTGRPDDARQAGDALDRLIDEAVAAELRADDVDLRVKVLEGLSRGPAASAGTPADRDEPHIGDTTPRRSWLRPALLPLAGALLMVAGLAVLWQHANLQLTRAGHVAERLSREGPPANASRARTLPPTAAPTTTAPAAVVASAAVPREPRAPKAPAWLESDDERKIAGASIVQADEESEEPLLPGAPAGDLGDAIAPMPRLRPIVIQPLAAPPIPDAPPVSTLGRPVSTLADEVSRDRQDPGKPGGR
jgi:hypothetical protein